MLNDNVKRFIEVNIPLLEDNQSFEFFISAYNGLSTYEQSILVDILRSAEIGDVDSMLEPVLTYIVTRAMEDLVKTCRVYAFVKRVFPDGLLGLDALELSSFIVNNHSEWEHDITFELGHFIINVED